MLYDQKQKKSIKKNKKINKKIFLFPTYPKKKKYKPKKKKNHILKIKKCPKNTW